MKKIILLAVLASGAGYWLLLSRPARYYGESREYKCFTLRARGVPPEGIGNVLDRALEKISASEFFSPEARFDIYLPDGPAEYRFFAPFVAGDYARVNPFDGGILLAAADFAQDKAGSASGDGEARVLNKVIAAAAARELVRRRLALLTYLSMRDWKVGGYAERISGGLGQFVPEDICSREAPEGSALRDYKYGLAVDFLIKMERISFADLLKNNYGYEGVERQIKRRYCGK